MSKSNSTFNWRLYAKAGLAFAVTTATYFWARSTGVLPAWFQSENQLDRGIQQDLGEITAGQRRLLQQAVVVAHPIPDQVVEVTQPYVFSLQGVFAGDYDFIGGLVPISWGIEYKLISTYLGRVGCSLQGVAISGNTLLMACGAAGLDILDVSSLNSPRLLSTYPAGTRSIIGVAISGNTAVVADYFSIKILDVSDTSNPRLLSSYPTSGGAYSVAIDGSTALVAIYTGDIQILSVSNTSNPRLLSTYPGASQGYSLGVAISGGTAFIADSSVGLKILNVSNPSNPQLLSTYPVSGGTNVAINGSTAFMVGAGKLCIFDVRNTSNSKMLSNGAFPVLPGGIAVTGNKAFVVSGGLQIFDFSQASVVGVPPSYYVGLQLPITVNAWANGQVPASDGFVLTLDPFPQAVQSRIADQSIYPGHSQNLLLDSELLFVNPTHSLLRLSMKLSNGAVVPSWLNLTLPRAQTIFYTAGYANGVAISGNTAFVVADGVVGLQIIDVSNPSSPQLLSTTPAVTNGTSRGVAINGSRAFVADAGAGLRIFDVSNLASPRLLSTFSSGIGYAQGVVISGDTAFVADNAVGLQIIDVSNTSNPRWLSTFPNGLGGNAHGIAVSDNTAFVANWGAGLQIIDVTNTSNPKLLSTFSAGAGYAAGVVISGTEAFVADQAAGLQIIDIKNMSNPQLLAIFPVAAGGAVCGVAISGNMAFVADNKAGLRILDVSNTSNPQSLSTFSAVFGGTACGVVINGSKAFIADWYAGLQILDLAKWQLTASPRLTDAGNYYLQLTATDMLGGSVSTQPVSIRVEGSPQMHGNISSQYARVGQSYRYFIPQGLFTDPNFDPIIFTAGQSGGQLLPIWLRFNGISATFAGTPPVAGNYKIFLSATDNIAGFANTTFNLSVTHLPVVDQPVIDQVARIDAPFWFALPSTAFSDLDNDVLIYSAQLSSDQPLPDWLNFNSTTQIFAGFPNQTDAGIYNLQVMVTDPLGGKASMIFNIFVENFPVSNQTIAEQIVVAGQLFNFDLPSNVFIDLNGNSLVYRARRPDGSLLPNWLVFNSQTLIFSGLPPVSDLGMLAVQVIVSDPYGATATQNFNLTVISIPTLDNPIADQVLDVGATFRFSVPRDAFSYIGAQPLIYMAYQNYNQSLPSWLSFNATALEFFGTSPINQTGQYNLSVTASDIYSTQVSAEFRLVVKFFPTVNRIIPPVIASVGNPLDLTIAGDSFAEVESEPLTYSARRADDSGIPNWLTFDSRNLIFFGVPVITDAGTLSLKLIATDPYGGSAQQNFNVTIHYSPVLTPIPSIPRLREERLFNLTLPNQTFTDPGQSALTYIAVQASGAALPTWLTFDADTLTFSGTPAFPDVGLLNLQLSATNSEGGYVTASIPLDIWKNYPPEVTQAVSNQMANVGRFFSFFVSTDTFIDLNNDTLSFSATQADGRPLPNWLRFDAKKLGFSGTPGRSDTGDFSDAIIPVALTAHDDLAQTSTRFNINVQGTSNVVLFLQVTIPLLSGLATVYGLYKERAEIINRCRKQRYQRIDGVNAMIGEEFKYTFDTPLAQVKKVQVKIPLKKLGCCSFFKFAYDSLPGGGDLPSWMIYDTNKNTLCSRGPIPEKSPPELIVQVQNTVGVILEQFTLRVTSPHLELRNQSQDAVEIEMQRL